MQRLTQYDTYPILVADIFFDPDFNCRGEFTLDSVEELANSIQVAGGFPTGLKYPITVQPWDQRPGFKYRLVAGHRRFRAVTIYLKWTEVPAFIAAGLNEFEARKLNFLENLERRDLNIVDEARAIRRLFPTEGRTAIGLVIKCPKDWISLRLRLLKLPEKVQGMLAAGLLLPTDVAAVDIEGGPDVQIKMADKIMEARKERRAHHPRSSGIQTGRTVNTRGRKRIHQMVAQMLDAGITGLAPRVGAWCAGDLPDEELLADIQAELQNRQHPDGPSLVGGP